MVNLESTVKIKPTKKSIRHQYKLAAAVAAFIAGTGFLFDYVSKKETDTQQESSTTFAEAFTKIGLGFGILGCGLAYRDSKRTIIINKDYRTITTERKGNLVKKVRYNTINVLVTRDWIGRFDGVGFVTIGYDNSDEGYSGIVTTFQENAEDLKKKILE